MANRYWVGGSGGWNFIATTNWSNVSGGSAGASAPTSGDSVFFDQAGSYTVTINALAVCLDITVSAGTVTFASGTTPTLTVYGSMSLVAATNWSGSFPLTFAATSTGKTITTNGVSISGNVNFSGVGGGWTLVGAMTCSRTTFTNGTFNTGNYAFTPFDITNAGTGTTSVSLGSSTLTLSSSWDFSNTTGLTFNAGTSTINIYSASASFLGGGLTYYNLGLTYTFGGNNSFTGANTFNNLTFSAGNAGRIKTVSFSNDQTVNGTLSTSGSTAVSRVYFKSNTFNTTRTITAAAESLSYVDFQDITAAGASGTWSGTSFADCGGNTNITFTAAKTVYWNLAGAQNWSATGWATSSGGAPALANFPIAQDTAVFDNTGSVTGTITINNNWNIGTINMSARTTAMTLDTSTNTPFIYLSWLNGSGTTLSGTGVITFSGRTTQQITSASKTFTQPITINNVTGTVQCNDALNIGTTNALTFISGALQLKSSATSVVGSFVTTGTTLKYLQSTTSGTQATISDASGTNSPTYLSIKDSNATGGATWSASGTGNVNLGNNTGWTGLPALASTGNFFLLFG